MPGHPSVAPAVVPVFASDTHRRHAPEREIESSAFQVPYEHPGRADAIRAALASSPAFDVREPPQSSRAAIEAVHEPGLVEFLESAWQRYQRDVAPTHDVVPDVFAMGGLRAGMGDGVAATHDAAQLGSRCFETTTDGMRRCGARVASLGLPLVVVQEGGYADSSLGSNVRSWLLGAASHQRSPSPRG